MGNIDTKNYKRKHPPKPYMGESGQVHQGIYVPENPGKVLGGEIITRSSWEMAFARWCDTNPMVVEWGCETVKIQYRNPAGIDFAVCKSTKCDPANPINWPIANYYPDFYVHLIDDKDEDNKIEKKWMIEIKPLYQTQRPTPPPQGSKLKTIRAYNDAVRTYLQNKAKWEAANIWCKDHGIDFYVFTEDTLHKIGLI